MRDGLRPPRSRSKLVIRRVNARRNYSPPGAPAAAGASREQRDQPDEGEYGRDDEEPVDGEADAESDDRENGKQYEQEHASLPPGLYQLCVIRVEIRRWNGRRGQSVARRA